MKRKYVLVLLIVIITAIALGAVCGKLLLDHII